LIPALYSVIFIKRITRAFDSAEKIDVSILFWDPMIKAATPGQLNLTEDAGKMLNRFTQLMPDAHSQIKDILGSFLLSLDLNNEILE